jgi:hypothetical protein
MFKASSHLTPYCLKGKKGSSALTRLIALKIMNERSLCRWGIRVWRRGFWGRWRLHDRRLKGWTSGLKRFIICIAIICCFTLYNMYLLIILKSELWTKQALLYLYFIYDCFMYLVICHVLSWVYILLASMFVTAKVTIQISEAAMLRWVLLSSILFSFLVNCC